MATTIQCPCSHLKATSVRHVGVLALGQESQQRRHPPEPPDLDSKTSPVGKLDEHTRSCELRWVLDRWWFAAVRGNLLLETCHTRTNEKYPESSKNVSLFHENPLTQDFLCLVW